jgi:hypothetical protein
MSKLTGLVLVSAAFALPATAQWIDYPTPGIPRTADGKPNLSAPTPRTSDGKPDLSGLWRPKQTNAGETDKALHAIKAQAWAQELSKKRKENLDRDDMTVLCLPLGPRAEVLPDKIIQTPAMLILLYGDLTYRQVFLDGRPLPKDPNPTWMGYSVGHWEGDSMLIESSGFNDRTWLDGEGHPHSEALHLTERIRRPDFGHLEIEKTYEDPKALTQPLVVPLKLEFYPDTEMLEYVCAENERDHSHLVGTAADDTKNEVKVEPAILQQYVGVYILTETTISKDPLQIDISLEANKLMGALSGGVKYALTPVSETKFFFQGFQLEFVKNEKGQVTDIVAHTVEGDFKAPRK